MLNTLIFINLFLFCLYCLSFHESEAGLVYTNLDNQDSNVLYLRNNNSNKKHQIYDVTIFIKKGLINLSKIQITLHNF